MAGVATTAVAVALAGCGRSAEAPASAAKSTPATKPKPPKQPLDIYIPRDLIRLGGDTTVRGITADHKLAKVALEADSYPFGHFHRIATTTAGRRGRYVFHIRPTRNTRYRLHSLDGRQATSSPVPVHVFPKFDTTASWAAAGLVNFSVTLHVPHGLRYQPTRVYFYVHRPEDRGYALVGHGSVGRESSTSLAVHAQLGVGNSTGFRWMACARRTPAIGMGITGRVHNCGAKQLTTRGVVDGAAFI